MDITLENINEEIKMEKIYQRHAFQEALEPDDFLYKLIRTLILSVSRGKNIAKLHNLSCEFYIGSIKTGRTEGPAQGQINRG